MKKILTFIIIIAMTLSLGVPAFAATPATVTVASPTAAVNPGDTVDVAVTIADNPGMDVMKLKFSYDTAALTLKDIELGSVMGILTKNLDKAVALLEAAGTTNATGNGTLVTLKFEVKSTAAAGNYTIGFLVSDAVNRNEERVALTTQAGTVSVAGPVNNIYRQIQCKRRHGNNGRCHRRSRRRIYAPRKRLHGTCRQAVQGLVNRRFGRGNRRYNI